jgi:predicted S18 family serine protease
MISLDQNKRPAVEDMMAHPRIGMVIRELNFKDVVASIQKKEKDIAQREEALKAKEEACVTAEQEVESRRERLRELELRIKQRKEKLEERQ